MGFGRISWQANHISGLEPLVSGSNITHLTPPLTYSHIEPPPTPNMVLVHHICDSCYSGIQCKSLFLIAWTARRRHPFFRFLPLLLRSKCEMEGFPAHTTPPLQMQVSSHHNPSLTRNVRQDPIPNHNVTWDTRWKVFTHCQPLRRSEHEMEGFPPMHTPLLLGRRDGGFPAHCTTHRLAFQVVQNYFFIAQPYYLFNWLRILI
jgi:hypothetical protein